MMDSVEQSDDDCIYELAYEEHIHFDYCSLSPPRPSCSKEESRERKSSSPSSESGYICLGGTDHVLLFINDHFTLEDDLEDVTTFLTVLQDSGLPIRLRLLNTSRCSVELYLKRNPFKKAFKNDLYGFKRCEEYLEADKNFNKMQSLIATQRDLDWINYLSSIGGTENIKSDGIYKSSPELKKLVRRGVPIAYRSIVWTRISLSSQYRKSFPDKYYSSLAEKESLISKRVLEEIEKDLERCAIFFFFAEHNWSSNSTLVL